MFFLISSKTTSINIFLLYSLATGSTKAKNLSYCEVIFELFFERAIKIKTTKNRLRRHALEQKEMAARLINLAKKAISLNDETAFKKIGRQLIWTNNDIRRWERYMLSLEMLETRYDQVRASVDLLTAVKSMSEALSELDAPGKLGELQANLEKGLAKASNLEQQIEVMMDVMDGTLAGDMNVDPDELNELEKTLAGEVADQESSAFDPEIEQLRQKIKKEMSNQ